MTVSTARFPRLRLPVPRTGRPNGLRSGAGTANRVVGSAGSRPEESRGDRLRRVLGVVTEPLVRVTAPVRWAGLTILLAGAVCLATGARWDWDEVVLAGAAAWGAVLTAGAFALGRSSYGVQVDMRSRRVVVGDRALGRLVTTNTSRRRLLPARLELPVGRGRAVFQLPAMAGGAQHEDVFVVPTARRGVVTVGPVSSVRGDALGLVRREVVWTEPQELFVHPRTVVLEGAAPGFLRDLEGHPVPILSNSDISFHALRSYVPGDDRRYVHWRTSARTGTLMVRQFEETRRSHVAVLLSTHTDEYAADDELELAVSACASLSVQTLREERDLSVLTSTQSLRVGSAPRLLDDLCRVEREASAPRLGELTARVGLEIPGASVAFVICGSVLTAGQLAATVTRLPVDVRTVVVRCTQDAAPGVRPLGRNVTVVTTAGIDDLGRGLRQAARS